MDESNITEIHRSLGRIEGKQDAIMSAQVGLRADHEELKKDVSDLKSKVNYWIGGIAVIGSVVMFFRDKIMEVFA